MKKSLLMLLVLCYAFVSYAQSEFIRKETDTKGSIIFAEFTEDSAKNMKESAQILKQLHAMEDNEAFVLTDSKMDELGFTHHYFAQYYKGVRVAYSSYSVHGKNDIVNTANGTYNKVGVVDTNAKLSEKEALEYAIKYVGADTYKWEIPEEEQWLKVYYNQSYYPEGESVIVKDKLITGKQFRLAWKFDIYAHMPLSRKLIYVDAITGEILDTESKIHFANSQGTAATRYSGTRNITTDSFTGGFRLRETRNNVRIETYNMRNRGTNYSGAPDFTDNNNSWTAAEFNNAHMDNAALDAHWAAEMFCDYFRTTHNRNSWNASGGPLLNYVHANLLAFDLTNNINAFWDGQRVTYGDGDFCNDPLTSLDIVAHEFAHAINSSSAKMKYEGESGALNESLSDIWAACVEAYAAPNKQNWLIAEDITLCAPIIGRSLSNPNDFSQPDTYPIDLTNPPGPTHVDFWHNPANLNNDHGGVHINSGVPNFWFFLLVNGGTDTNDLGNNFSVDGIGINKAAKIVYRAETFELFSKNEQIVSFNQFRNATIAAASDLYGLNTPEIVAVTNAWHAVGVGERHLPYVSGSDRLCLPSGTYTLENVFPANATVTWSVSPSSYFHSSTQSGTGTTALLKPVSNDIYYSGNLIFTVNGVNISKSIIVGNTPAQFIGPSDMITHRVVSSAYVGVQYEFRSTNGTSNDCSDYQWEITAPPKPPFVFLPVLETCKTITYIGPSAGYHIVKLSQKGECGTYSTSTRNYYFLPNPNHNLSIYPNPSSGGEVTITFETTDKSAMKSAEEWDIEVYDTYQSPVLKKTSIKNTEYKLNTSGWRAGVYYINAKLDGNVYEGKLVVQ